MLLAVYHSVVGLDLDAARVAKVNGRQSLIEEPELSRLLAEETLDLRATDVPPPSVAGSFRVFRHLTLPPFLCGLRLEHRQF